MTDHEKNLLLAVLKHHLPQDLRHTVMREVPHAYNAWMERDILKVVHTNEERVVT